MDEIIEKIRQMESEELRHIMEAVQWRYRAAFPDWDVIYLAVHKDPALRKQELRYILQMLDPDILP